VNDVQLGGTRILPVVVLAAGASWLAAPALPAAGDYAEITRRAAAAVALT